MKKPRYNLVSVRLSDDEREALDLLMIKYKCNASDVLRIAFNQFYSGTHQ